VIKVAEKNEAARGQRAARGESATKQLSTLSIPRQTCPSQVGLNPPPPELRILDFAAWWKARRRYLLAQAATYSPGGGEQ
jgi:hypothetical protein